MDTAIRQQSVSEVFPFFLSARNLNSFGKSLWKLNKKLIRPPKSEHGDSAAIRCRSLRFEKSLRMLNSSEQNVQSLQKDPFLQGRNGHRDPCQKFPL